MRYKTIIRIRYNKEKEVRKICEDFKKTSENAGEKFIYEINNNILTISGCKDVKHAYRISGWFERNFPDKVIYGIVKKIEEPK